MTPKPDLLDELAPLFPPPELPYEGLLRRRDRRRGKQRFAAGALAAALCLIAAALFVRALHSEPSPADAPKPSPSTERVGFVGLPPEGATPSTPPSGELVISFNGPASQGVRLDLYVYADGTMIWQKWSSSSVSVGVPVGANQFNTGNLEQRLTMEGVELLRSRILSTGLFEHDLELRLRGAFTIGIRNDDRPVFVSGYSPNAGAAAATPAQERALVRLEAILADPAAWLPSSAWADREIRAYVPSRYNGGFDRRVASPSELPPAAAELLFGRKDCRLFTIEEVRTISTALEDAGITPSLTPDGQPAFTILKEGSSYPAYLHFWPVIPDLSDFLGGDEGGRSPRC